MRNVVFLELSYFDLALKNLENMNHRFLFLSRESCPALWSRLPLRITVSHALETCFVGEFRHM